MKLLLIIVTLLSLTGCTDRPLGERLRSVGQAMQGAAPPPPQAQQPMQPLPGMQPPTRCQSVRTGPNNVNTTCSN